MPSGHNCRRQLATGRPEQIQEPGTAVPGTPIFANNAKRGGPPLESPCRLALPLHTFLSPSKEKCESPIGLQALLPHRNRRVNPHPLFPKRKESPSMQHPPKKSSRKKHPWLLPALLTALLAAAAVCPPAAARLEAAGRFQRHAGLARRPAEKPFANGRGHAGLPPRAAGWAARTIPSNIRTAPFCWMEIPPSAKASAPKCWKPSR